MMGVMGMAVSRRVTIIVEEGGGTYTATASCGDARGLWPVYGTSLVDVMAAGIASGDVCPYDCERCHDDLEED